MSFTSKSNPEDKTSISRFMPEQILRMWNGQAPKACPSAITISSKDETVGSIVMSPIKYCKLSISCASIECHIEKKGLYTTGEKRRNI